MGFQRSRIDLQMPKEKSLNLSFDFYIVTHIYFSLFFLDFQQILKYCLNYSAPIVVPLPILCLLPSEQS